MCSYFEFNIFFIEKKKNTFIGKNGKCYNDVINSDNIT